MVIRYVLLFLGWHTVAWGCQKDEKTPALSALSQPAAQVLSLQSLHAEEKKEHKEATRVDEAVQTLRNQAEKHIARYHTIKAEEQKIVAELQQDSLLQRMVKLPVTVQSKIHATYFDQIKMLAYRHRLALLPALFPGTIDWFYEEDVLKKARPQSCRWYMDCLGPIQEMYEDFRSQPQPPQSIGKFIVSGYLYQNDSSYRGAHNFDDCECKTPGDLFGFSIPQACFAAIGWSDGQSHIVLHDAERAELEGLSYDQLIWISSLYKLQSYKCTEQEYALFISLPKTIQQCLRSNYPLEFPCEIQTALAQQEEKLKARLRDIENREALLEEQEYDLACQRERFKKIYAQLRYCNLVATLITKKSHARKKENPYKNVYF